MAPGPRHPIFCCLWSCSSAPRYLLARLLLGVVAGTMFVTSAITNLCRPYIQTLGAPRVSSSRVSSSLASESEFLVIQLLCCTLKSGRGGASEQSPAYSTAAHRLKQGSAQVHCGAPQVGWPQSSSRCSRWPSAWGERRQPSFPPRARPLAGHQHACYTMVTFGHQSSGGTRQGIMMPYAMHADKDFALCCAHTCDHLREAGCRVSSTSGCGGGYGRGRRALAWEASRRNNSGGCCGQVITHPRNPHLPSDTQSLFAISQCPICPSSRHSLQLLQHDN